MTELEIACNTDQAELIISTYDDIDMVLCEGDHVEWMNDFNAHKLIWDEPRNKLIGVLKEAPYA